jgi:hypothetical protein
MTDPLPDAILLDAGDTLVLVGAEARPSGTGAAA